jgi:hypothetical protein
LGTQQVPQPPPPCPARLQECELGDEPAAGEGVLELGFRLPGGERCTRRFGSSETVGALYAYVAQQGARGCSICTQFPRRELADRGQRLGDAGLGGRDMLNVEKNRQ